MGLSVTILGANSAIPTATRYPTAQVVDINQSRYLVDCGEGAQMQLRRNRIKLQRIKAIFISHLHGDHYFGLIGLINTMHMLGRNIPLHIYGPPQLLDVLNLQLDLADTKLSYPWKFHALTFDESKLIYNDVGVEVHTIPLDHGIECSGFLFKEKPRKRKIIRELIGELNIPLEQIPKIKAGADFIHESGEVYPNDKVTVPPKPSYSYAYCSDTQYNERIIPIIKEVDLLYHEATFLEDRRERAQHTKHSTAKDAATIAKKANVGNLIIGHYSARYFDFQDHLDEAKTVFEQTYLAREGMVFELPKPLKK